MAKCVFVIASFFFYIWLWVDLFCFCGDCDWQKVVGVHVEASPGDLKVTSVENVLKLLENFKWN